jgi:putative tricarboxylic transport membrane protein
LFAFSQLLSDLEDRVKARQSLSQSGGVAVKIEHRKAAATVLRHWSNLLRSSLIGVFTGILPAAGSSISNILAYDQAKKASKQPEKFGTGCEDGIIAPESANNATAGGALITMMALGIPGDIVTAVMLGALLIHDIIPSPTFITESPALAYSLFLAFFVAHFMMLALQSYTLRIFVLVTKVRMYILASIILAYCAIGVFALSNIAFDIWTLFWFGVLGYLMRIFGFPLAPMILGVVLGGIAEQWLSRALARSDDLSYFVTSPWSLFFLILAAFSMFFPKYQADRGKSAWTLFYPAIFTMSLSVPAFMMGGSVRIVLGVLLIAMALRALFKNHRNGWKVDPRASSAPQLREG